MTFALTFYVLMLIWFVYGAASTNTGWPAWGGNLLLFLLILILGWRAFGPPIHG